MVDLHAPSAEAVLHPEIALFSSIKVSSEKIPTNVLREKYEVLGLSAQQIADEFASSKSAVLEALKQAGVQMRAKTNTHGRPANPPYGKHMKDGKLKDCPKEQKVIRLIQKLASGGSMSYRAIAKKLEDLGIKNRSGKVRWHHENIKMALKRYPLKLKEK